MNEHDLEDALSDWYARTTRDAAPDWLADNLSALPDHLPIDAHAQQRRHRWLGWLIRFGDGATRSATDDGDPNDAHDSRRTMMLITTGIAAVTVLAIGATQLLPVERTAPWVIPAAGTGASLVVAQDGSGDHATIGAAVEAASDGDTIVVRPGRYVESVAVVGKDVTITGDGDRGAVTVEAALALPPWAPADAPESDAYAWAFALLDSDATLSNMAIEAADSGVEVGGASAPTLVGLDIGPTSADPDGGTGVWFGEGTRGELRDSRAVGWIGLGSRADVSIVDNDLPATCISIREPGAHATISGNTLHGCPQEFGIVVDEGGSATIEGNDIWVEAAASGVEHWANHQRTAIVINQTDAPVVIRDNDIHDSVYGVAANGGADVRIEGNRVTANEIAISLASVGASVVGNTVSGNETGVLVAAHSPTLEANTITDNVVGLRVGVASPTLAGNTVCENGTNLVVQGDRDPPDTTGNEICPDVVADVSG